MAGHHGRARHIGVPGLLMLRLEAVYGSRHAAESTLRQALSRARLAAVPDSPVDALQVVRAHLLGRLSGEIGPRIAMALVDDLTERAEEPPESGVIPLAP